MTASILAPLTGDFGTLAAAELIIVGAACGAVGVWVLHFGQAILAESFTHALLPGLVLATIIGGGLVFGAVAGVVVAYLLLVLASRAPKTSSPSANSVAVTLLVAIGALLASRNDVPDFESLLFGDPLAASGREVGALLVLAVLIALALLLLEGPFAVLAFDPRAARALGVSPAIFSAVALALLAVSVSIAANVAGSLLALGLVTGPALGALAISDRLRSSLLIAALAGALSGVAGLYISYYADWPASASIAVAICTWAVAASAAGALRTRPWPLV